MVDAAEARYEVTVPMLKRKLKLTVTNKTLLKAIREKGHRWHRLRAKPLLTKEDVKDRMEFARRYLSKTAAWWRRSVHVHLDNEHFKVATTDKTRKLLARMKVRGVYWTSGKSLRSSIVKPNTKLRQNTGSKGVLIAGGVGGGRVLIWHEVEGSWCGTVADDFYRDCVGPSGVFLIK